MSVNCWIISGVAVFQPSMSLNDSSSVVAGDESKLVPVCGLPGVVDVDVLTASS